MLPTLAERLESARRQQFVGRSAELELFREALSATEYPFAVLYIHGPGGVGKTSLLREYAHIARQLDNRLCRLDGRNLEAAPEYFRIALQEQLNLIHQGAIDPTLTVDDGRTVLLIDTAELLSPLESWLRETFLPALPDNTLTVFAGRNPPSQQWRSDPGWQTFMHLLPLENFNQEESRTYLRQRQVPATEHGSVLDFTHGHPLALSLVADVFAQKPKTEFRAQDAPDVIKALVEQFTQEAPTTYHRTALEASSQVFLLNEPLLASMVLVEDPYPLLEWLRGLSFFDANQSGLYPHDLAREVLSADLRWRNPDWQAELHNRARAYYMAQFRAGNERQQRRVLNEYVFLHRENPVIRPYFEWKTSGVVYTDRMRPDDRSPLLNMVRNHEGDIAANIAGHWLDQQPDHTFVLRKAADEPQGLLTLIDLSGVSAADRDLDPATDAACRFLVEFAPLRPGETATLFRFWIDNDTYQDVSPTQSRIFLNMVQHYLTTPGLAYTFIPCADPDFWTAMFAFADLQRLPAADFEVDGRRYGVYGHDWRVVPPLMWLEVLAGRELDLQSESEDTPPAQTVAVMDEVDFKSAVRQALNDFTDVLALQDNPLLQSRLIIERLGISSGASERVVGLQELLRETAASLQNNPRHKNWYRVIYHTYIQPARTQEAAAELLDLPFSTYRRHLQAGIKQIAELLWRMEVGSTSL